MVCIVYSANIKLFLALSLFFFFKKIYFCMCVFILVLVNSNRNGQITNIYRLQRPREQLHAVSTDIKSPIRDIKRNGEIYSAYYFRWIIFFISVF